MADRNMSVTRWLMAALIMGVVAFLALVATPASGSQGLTKDDLVRAGFSCERYDVDGGIVVCVKDPVSYVCDKDGNGCVEAPDPNSKLTKDDLENGGYSCKFHNISGGLYICAKPGSATYYCDKTGGSCIEAPLGDRTRLA